MHRHKARVETRHQGGEGEAGTPGVLTPRCSATRISCMRLCGTHTHHAPRTTHHAPLPPSSSPLPHTHTPPPPPPPAVELKQVDPCALNCCGTPAVAMSERGAAVRRRERRLEAWHRHERMTVAMELVTKRGIGGREVLRATATEASTPREAAGTS